MALNAKLVFKICAKRGASLGVTMFFSLIKRALAEVFQIFNRQTEEHEERGKKTYCDYLEQGL